MRVALLARFDVPLATALPAAVVIGLMSLWFAMVCGFVALCALEFKQHKRGCVDENG
jgi:hypothetical protein